MLDIAELELVDENEAKMAEHAVSASEILQTLDDKIVVLKNKKGKAGNI